jgi:hypothetical protein
MKRKKGEMRFGLLKTHHGFDRMRLRGLSGANDEFHLSAITQNLKTMALRLTNLPGRAAAPHGDVKKGKARGGLINRCSHLASRERGGTRFVGEFFNDITALSPSRATRFEGRLRAKTCLWDSLSPGQ